MKRMAAIPKVADKPWAWMGVDPGKSGAACLLTEDKGFFFVDWPKDDDTLALANELKQWQVGYEIRLCVLEKVHAMPKQGVSSTFSFGANFGAWRAILSVLQVPHVLITPQAWQKGLVTKSDGDTPKKRVMAVVKRLFPAEGQHFVGPKGAWKDGRADAALMAWRAREMT